ncbi:MAG: glycosyl hydrolase [Pseudomonadota bacterium]
MISRPRLLSLLAAGVSALAVGHADDHSPLASIPMRELGPAITSGRISDFAMMPGGHHHMVVGTASGGIWITENAGTTWKPVFDNYGSYAIGVVEIAPSSPNVVYAGTGENNSQRSVAFGDGVYRSDDGGKSWRNIGLKDSAHISQIWVDPNDADHVLVASQGPLWNEGGDRGLYRSRDGGGNWELVLEIDENTGVNEFVVHPDDHDMIIASSYQRRRHVWTLINGGPGSSVHITTDGGKTWKKGAPGFPKGELGRIGLGMAPSQPGTVYAIVEADDKQKGVYRTTSFGTRWEKRSSFVAGSPQYYNELIVDPKEPNRVYAMDTFASVSEDGGKTFKRLSNKARHVDDHALWINPENTAHLIIGGDGGIYESYDRGATWRHMRNLPLTQFYRATPDNAAPFYNVCGGTQDNNSLCAPSRTPTKHGITNADWTLILGGDGYKPVSDPTDPNIIYTQYQYGGLARYDRRTQERVFIVPMAPPGEDQYKFNWNTPLLISPHDSKTILYAAEKVFRSKDRGDSWEVISPDLTRQLDRNALEVMGRVWGVDTIAKNDSTSMYGSIIGLSESSLAKGLIYAGTDDGVISVTEDDGATWRSERSFSGVPDMALIEDIITSVHDADTAYAVFDNHKKGDHKPYVYVTTDRGKNWKNIGKGLPERGAAHTIAEDHENPDLLFVGTEFGLFFTRDGGKDWHKMTGGLPTIAVRDLEIQRRENDLVVATFGRGIFIVDDYSPLRADDEALEADAVLFPVKDAWQYIEGDIWGGYGGPAAFQGDAFYNADNPAYGAVFTYHLKDGFKSMADERRAEEKKIAKDGGDTPYPSWDDLRAEDREQAPEVYAIVRNMQGDVVRRIKAPKSKGMHRISWDLSHDSARPVSLSAPSRSLFGGSSSGPIAKPGTYTVHLVKQHGGKEETLTEAQSFTVKPLNRSPEAAEDRGQLEADHLAMRDLSIAMSAATRKAGEVKERMRYLEAAMDRVNVGTAEQRAMLAEARTKLLDTEEVLYGDRTRASRNEPSPIGLSSRIGRVTGATWGTLAPVGGQHKEQMEFVTAEYARVRSSLTEIEGMVASIEEELTAAGAPYTPGRSLPTAP